MTKLLPAIALLVLPALAAPALAETRVAFERGGTHFVATDRTVDGVRLIEGREVETGTTFALRVANNRIRGRYGYSRVNLPVGARAAGGTVFGSSAD